MFQTARLAAQEAPEPEPLPKPEKVRNKAQEEAVVQAKQQAERARQQVVEVRDQLRTLVRRSGDVSAPALVVRTSDTDPKTQASLEEDLAIMSRILEKAVQPGDDGHPRHAMGINVLFGPGPGSIRSLYIEGYGALFMLNVNFPLLPPPAKPDEEKKESPKSSTWEDAKRELYGQSKESTRKFAGPPSEDYSEDKVKTLKDALLESLKNASNIRDLKADESITVCVFGGGTGGMVRYKTLMKRPLKIPTDGEVEDELLSTERVEPPGQPGRGTMMAIRVRKSDAEGFASGKLSLEEFRKRTSITTTTCAADVGRWTGGFSYGFGAGGGGVGGGFGGGANGFGGGGGGFGGGGGR